MNLKSPKTQSDNPATVASPGCMEVGEDPRGSGGGVLVGLGLNFNIIIFILLNIRSLTCITLFYT